MATTSSKSKNETISPYGSDFYIRIATALLSNDPKSLDDLKEMANMVQKSKLKPTDELWDGGDEFSAEAEVVFKAANRPKKVKPGEKEKKTDEKTDKEKEKSVDVDMDEE